MSSQVARGDYAEAWWGTVLRAICGIMLFSDASCCFITCRATRGARSLCRPLHCVAYRCLQQHFLLPLCVHHIVLDLLPTYQNCLLYTSDAADE